VIREVPASAMAELAGTILELGWSVRMRVKGDSMRPALLNGDEVWLAPAGARGPRRGEMVAVRTADSMYIHRLVRRRRDGLILTAGDNVSHRDAATRECALLGVVRRVERDGRAFSPGRGHAALWLAEARRGWAAVGRRWSSLRLRSLGGTLR